MPTTYNSTDTITLYSTLINYDPETGEEEPVNADEVDGIIYKWNGTAYVEHGTFNPIDDPAVGMVSYDWVPGSEGKFKIVFHTEVQTHAVDDVREIYIGPLTPTETLGIQIQHDFLAEFEPMYLDPEEVLIYYPAGDATEIAESIYLYSKRVNALTGETEWSSLSLDEQIKAHDYILAAVLCDYSRRMPPNLIPWGFPEVGGLSEDSSFTLGDLQVSQGSGTSAGGGSSSTQYYAAKYGNAESWCQLAAFLRDDLSSSSAGIKSYTKAIKQPVVVRTRAFHRFE